MIVSRSSTLLSAGLAALGLLLLTGPALAQGADVLRVPSEYLTLQDAIDAASHGDTVLVADGVYTGPGNRDVDFLGKNITVRSEGGTTACTIDCEGTSAEPYRAFLFQSGEGPGAVLEGFTITGGATLPGAVADPFNGGGVFIVNSSPTIRDCLFIDNQCGCWGAALYAGHGGSPLVENCMFVDNYANDDGGGLFVWNGASITVRNSVFLRNGAAVTGGAIADFGSAGMTLENVTIARNTAPFGGGIYSFGNLDLRHTIVVSNTGGEVEAFGPTILVEWSNIAGGYAGIGNIDADPRFLPDGYHLSRFSPCINAGDPGHSAAGQSDIDGQPRIKYGRVDMGADEAAPRTWGTHRKP